MHRYVFFSAHYRPHMGGIEAFTERLAAEMVRQGNKVMVATTQLGSDPAHELQPDGVEVVRLPAHLLMAGRLPISRRSGSYKRIWQHMLDWAPDRVLINARFYRHSVEGLRFAQEAGAKAVLLDHGSAYLSLSNPVADTAIKVYEHAITTIDKRYHPIYAGVSQKSCEWLKTFGINTDIVINNAIDAAAFRALSSGRDFRGELGLTSPTFLAAYIGRFIPEKHPCLVVELAKRLPSVHFVLAGGGPLTEELQHASEHLKNLHLTGRLAQPDVSALLSQADCLLMPTRSEGMSTSMLEAGAWGTIPILPDVGGYIDAFGTTGLAIMVSEISTDAFCVAIQNLMSQTNQEKITLGAALRKQIETHCSWPHTAEQLKAAFATRAFA